MQARRSDFASRDAIGAARRPTARARGADGNVALRSARGTNNENANPKVDVAAKRRSPRLGAVSTCSVTNSSNRSLNNYSSTSRAVLSDITNNAAGFGAQAEKFKKPSFHSQQPPVAAPAPPPPATAESAQAADVAMEVTPAQDQAAQEADAQAVEEYAPGILNQFFLDETRYLPEPDYMNSQTDITAKMRTILIDWLVEVHMKYKLVDGTLHLTINLIDRYLAKAQVNRKRLQLIGVVAMFIASKYEEIRPPELHDWVYITDNAYTTKDVLHMECTMLTTLNFHIMVPTAAHFFEALSKANGCNETHGYVAQYLLELGLLDIRVLQHTPSHMVAAAMLLSNELMKRSTLWPASMVQQSRHTELALRGCAEDLRQLLEADHAGSGGQLQAVHKKFSVVQRHAVAKMKF
jgi:cyclin B